MFKLMMDFIIYDKVQYELYVYISFLYFLSFVRFEVV